MPQCINQLLFEYFLSPHVDKRRNTHLYLFLFFAPVNVLKLGISCKYSVTKSNQPLRNRDERIIESHLALHWLMGVVWFCMIFRVTFSFRTLAFIASRLTVFILNIHLRITTIKDNF